ncbi:MULTISPECIES: Fur family transcriptional regulator [unclassified Deinococcus]|uniref:Fur family transcriptional regulator n=1 Tax=unclassified Deinococcus TaxID=2623546 RepID=UPI000991B044|nr:MULTISPECIES: Fur family transcriptional regulator [unclassified Deinococcus]MCD0157606.1 transcriptional repressor [Deinococcus sp. 6GRE01]MCD0177746.1 transcriptional repressor [Deinococcus sp. 14RED07]OOV13544.1 transcriptional repressor [Deinococcus sp. LM3]
MTATRSTRQRDVITRIMQAAQGPLAVADVLDRARSDLPGLGIATVYRTLKLLTEQGRIHPVTLDGETLYEASGQGHHHHFSCQDCGRVFTLHTCPVALPSGTVYPGGFIVRAHEVTLYGQCPDCAAQPG